jgi:hypothetical protein
MTTWTDPSLIFNFFIVIFNGLLAFVTWRLVVSTNKLWRAAIDQALLTQRSIELTRSEFLATHRPRLRVRVVKVGGNSCNVFKIEYSVVNVGETPATITIHHIRLIADPMDINTKTLEQTISGDCLRLSGGEAKVVIWTYNFDFGSGHGAEYDTTFHVTSGGVLKIKGRLEYIDEVGVKRRTGFLRTYNQSLKYFTVSDDINEEFED